MSPGQRQDQTYPVSPVFAAYPSEIAPLSNTHLRGILSTLVTARSGSGNGSLWICERQAFFRRCCMRSMHGNSFALARATQMWISLGLGRSWRTAEIPLEVKNHVGCDPFLRALLLTEAKINVLEPRGVECIRCRPCCAVRPRSGMQAFVGQPRRDAGPGHWHR